MHPARNVTRGGAGGVTSLPDDGEIHKDLPKRTPLPETCVKYGAWHEHEALAPGRSPLQQEQMRDQARKLYQQALGIDPKYLPASLALAHLYASMGQPERAISTYRKALETHQQAAILWYELGMCYARQKEFEPALAHLRKAFELDPEERQFGNGLGFCLAFAGEYEESLIAFRKVVGEARAHYQLAQMLHRQNRDDLSRHHLQLALRADPRLTEAQQLLGELDRARG